MNRFPLIAAVAMSTQLLGGCASQSDSPMDTGERISQRGADIGEYGDAWSAGQKDVKRGERKVEKSSESLSAAQAHLVEARAQVADAEKEIQLAEAAKAEGEQMITYGTQQMQRAEANYSEIRSGPSANQPSPEN